MDDDGNKIAPQDHDILNESQDDEYPNTVNMICPTCGRSGYQYPLKNTSITKKKFLKVPIALWIVGLFLIVIFSCSIISFIYVLGPSDSQEKYDMEVIISRDGHFKYSLGFYLENKISFIISSKSGSNFDVYIMDEDQYENAYGSLNSSIISFSSFYSNENINSIDVNLDFTNNRNVYKEYYLIIDNRDTPLTKNDATPHDIITLDVEIIIDHSYYIM